MTYDKDVSLAALKEMLTYNPETGDIRWLKSPARNIYPGEVAGCVKALRKNKNGEDVKYRYIRLNGCNISNTSLSLFTMSLFTVPITR